MYYRYYEYCSFVFNLTSLYYVDGTIPYDIQIQILKRPKTISGARRILALQAAILNSEIIFPQWYRPAIDIRDRSIH